MSAFTETDFQAHGKAARRTGLARCFCPDCNDYAVYLNEMQMFEQERSEPTEQDLINWREANDYQNEGEN